MRDDVRSDLAAEFGDVTVEQQLHDVPPHEVYEVTVDGRRAVYKGDTGPTGNARVEGAVTAVVGSETSVPVPEVLWLDTEWYLAAWHPDAPTPDTEASADERWATAAGRGLATLHTETAAVVDGYGRFEPTIDAPGDPTEQVTLRTSGHDDWHAPAVEYVRDHRPVLERYGHADVAAEVLDFLGDRPAAFEGADTAVCCHGWATPEHLSVTDGDLACLLDFEHALAAPGEYDFWRTAFPAFEGASDPAHRAFRAGYESIRPLPEGFEERRPLYALLNSIYYFESLYVQDQHDPEATATKARGIEQQVRTLLDDLT